MPEPVDVQETPKVCRWVARLNCTHEAGDLSVPPKQWGLYHCGHIDCKDDDDRIVVDVVTDEPLRSSGGMIW